MGLSKYIATSFGKYNIRSNILSPGGVFDNQEKKFVHNYKSKVPLNRMANWSDYDGAILFEQRCLKIYDWFKSCSGWRMDSMVKNFFTNKVVFITGGSSGLGKTFVDFFLTKGAQVIVCCRTNTFKKFYSGNKKFHHFKFDLSQINKIKSLINNVITKSKKIDILINNAGIAKPKKLNI